MLNLEILSPEKVIYNGEVTAVILPGVTGGFEILKGHAPLISALGEGSIRVLLGSGEESFAIKSGFVEVLQNNVVVLVEGTE